jgi:hypothetical protein
MVVLFGLAVLLRLPGAGQRTQRSRPADTVPPGDTTGAADDQH